MGCSSKAPQHECRSWGSDPLAAGAGAYENCRSRGFQSSPLCEGCRRCRRKWLSRFLPSRCESSRRPSTPPRELEPFRPYRRVLCATDCRVLSPRLPIRGAQIARLFNSRLSIVSAIPCPAVSSPSGPERPSAQAVKRETTATINRFLAESQITASVHVVEGTEGEVIRQVAILEEADLIVIGQGRLEEPMGHLRTRAYEIIWNAPCPVLILSSNLLKP